MSDRATNAGSSRQIQHPAHVGNQLVGRHRHRPAAQPLLDDRLVEQLGAGSSPVGRRGTVSSLLNRVGLGRVERRVEEPAEDTGKRQPCPDLRLYEARPAWQHRPAADGERGEQAQHHRRGRAGSARSRTGPARPVATNEAPPAPNRISGSTARSGEAPDRDRESRALIGERRPAS